MTIKRLEKDRNGKMAIIGIAIVALIAIVVAAFVLVPAMTPKAENSAQVLGVTIVDTDTGKTVSGELSMDAPSPLESLFSLGNPSRTVTLAPMMSPAEMTVFNQNAEGIYLFKNYKIYPWVKVTTASESPSIYTDGKASVTFTGKTDPAYTAKTFLTDNGVNKIESLNKPIVFGTPLYMNYGNVSVTGNVAFSNVLNSNTISPLAGTYLTNAVIHAVVDVSYKTGGTTETKAAIADLNIKLVNPVSGTFSITINNFGV